MAKPIRTHWWMLGVTAILFGLVATLVDLKPVVEENLHYIHRSKTAALIRGAVRAGAICGGADAAQLEAVSRYGEQIGFAFQIVDDVLDVVESTAGLGKTAGKDAARQKATFTALYGVERSREMARQAEEEALAALEMFGPRADRLRDLAALIVERSA